MSASLLLRLLFQGVLLFKALGWEVKMPESIHGLKGSCLVIPCTFNYTSNPPKDQSRVVWYQWVSKGYPRVYDPLHPMDVIEKFRGKTNLYQRSRWDCSLLISKLDDTHNGEKLYTWIDPENVKWRTYAFYDVTSTIEVDAIPQPPRISIDGGEKIGDKITINCSASHTCPFSKPTIILNGIEGSDQTSDYCNNSGQCRFTLTRTAVVKAENTTFDCSVTHYGGITVKATNTQSSKCVHQKIMIEPEIADVIVGVAMIFTCSVYHSCQTENPTITWNYENIQVSNSTKTLSGSDRVTYSNITFLGAKEDHGKNLTCTAYFSRGNITESVVFSLQYRLTSGLKTTGLYIITPLFVFLLACILAGVIIYKKRQRSRDANVVLENKAFSKPSMPSPKSEPKSKCDKDYEAEYGNIEELNIYANV